MVSGLDALVVEPREPGSHPMASVSVGPDYGCKYARNIFARTPVAKCARSFSTHHARLRCERGLRRARGPTLDALRGCWLELGITVDLAGSDPERPRRGAADTASLVQVYSVWSLARRSGCIAGGLFWYWVALFLCG